MTYATVYDIANDSIDWQFPLIGLALILVGAVMKWGFGKPGWNSYPIMAIGVFTILASAAVPRCDYRRVTQAVARGGAEQVEGSNHDGSMAAALTQRTHV